MLTIPQCDPRAGYLAHKEEIDQAISRVLESGRYILGKELATFEQEFAAYIGVSHAIGVASGTDALHLALRACGIGPGDFVVTVSNTAVATVAAIELAGANPVLVDVDPDTFTMSAERFEVAIQSLPPDQPKAVIPVHLYGHPGSFGEILAVAGRYGVKVVEDCAQSHGALFQGKKTGSFGDVAAFSFYPTKNLSAIGDGGIIVTSDADIAERAGLLREYGWQERYVSYFPGTNSRLDELQAAVLRVKLKYLDEGNHRRQVIAKKYGRALSEFDLRLPATVPGATHVYHQFVIRANNRDELKQHLANNGIGALIHYPVPIHQQPAYAGRIRISAQLEQTELIAGEILSLPMFPELPDAHVEAVCDHIASLERLAFV